MVPASGTPYRPIMPVEMPDIAMFSEYIMPLPVFCAGGQRYRNQSCNGQRLDDGSSMSIHD
jgi:hypothetical protein